MVVASEIAYERILHKVAFGKNIIISILVGFLFIFGGLAVNEARITGILALLAFFSNLGREIVKDVEDLQGDKGVRVTLPIKIGIKNSNILASFVVFLAVGLSPLPYYPLGIFDKVYIPLVGFADAVFIYSISQFREPSIAKTSLKIAMLFALGAFMVGGIL